MSYLNVGVVYSSSDMLEGEDIAQHFKAKLFITECVETSTVFKMSSLTASNRIAEVFLILNAETTTNVFSVTTGRVLS